MSVEGPTADHPPTTRTAKGVVFDSARRLLDLGSDGVRKAGHWAAPRLIFVPEFPYTRPRVDGVPRLEPPGAAVRPLSLPSLPWRPS